MLETAGYEAWSPQIKNGKRVSFLWPGYVLIHITNGRWSVINYTPGISKLISFGDAPGRLPDREVDALRARMVGGFVELPPPPVIQVGDKIKVVTGIFANQTGLYAGMGVRKRVWILLSLLGSEPRIELDAQAVRLAAPEE
jgi:transcriptional antiterminator RfaH